MRKKEKEALSMALSPQEQILQSYENWFALNALYDKWAKAHGLTSNGLMTLYAIRIFPCCTQRTICEALALPKQTVNTILDGMQKKGYIRLDVLPTDRRSKRICLTPQGEAYAGPILDALDALEWRALQGIGTEQMEQKLALERRFLHCLSQALEEEPAPKDE